MISTVYERMDWDEYFIGLAYATSARSTCSRLNVGAVIVNPYYNIAGLGFNGAPRSVAHCYHDAADEPCRVSVHAEANALLFSTETRECSMYVTHAPCWECAKLIINAGIRRVTFSERYRTLEGLQMLDLGGVVWNRLERHE